MIRLLAAWFLLPGVAGAVSPVIVDQVRLFGNVRTRDRIVLREMRLSPGSPFSYPTLRADARWLERLGFFRRVELTAVPDSTGGKRAVLVVVKEKGVWSVDPSLSEDDMFGWTIGAGICRRNLFGRGQTLCISGKTGGLNQAKAVWSAPWVMGGLRLFLEASVQITHRQYLFLDYTPHFRERSSEAMLVAGKNLGRHERIGLRFVREWFHVDDPSVSISGNGRDVLSSLEWFQVWDSRDRLDYPRSGWYTETGIRWTGPFPRKAFMRSTVDIRHFVPRGRGACLAFQAAAMVSHGDVPVYKRLHVGGSQMLRGVPSGWIAGDNACLASTELRFPLLMEREVLGCDFSGTFGVVFCDAAAVWFPREWPDGIRTRLSAGMGLHFLWDGIVLRAECGALSDGRLFFTSSSGVKF